MKTPQRIHALGSWCSKQDNTSSQIHGTSKDPSGPPSIVAKQVHGAQDLDLVHSQKSLLILRLCLNLAGVHTLAFISATGPLQPMLQLFLGRLHLHRHSFLNFSLISVSRNCRLMVGMLSWKINLKAFEMVELERRKA